MLFNVVVSRRVVLVVSAEDLNSATALAKEVFILPYGLSWNDVKISKV